MNNNTNLEETLEEVERGTEQLKNEMERALENLKEMENYKYAPLWSGKTEDLRDFNKKLQGWLKSPKVSQARKIINTLKSIGSDERSFSNLPENFLVNSLALLENAENVINIIEPENSKKLSSKFVLTLILHENLDEIRSGVEKVKVYSEKIKKFTEEVKEDNEFTKVIKKEMLAELSQTIDFDRERIDRYDKSLKKALTTVENLRRFLANTALPLVREYQQRKDKMETKVDEIWDLADSLQRNLKDLEFLDTCKTSKIKESPYKILKHIVEIFNEREEALKQKSLSQICKKIEKVNESGKKWQKEIQSNIGNVFNTIRTLLKQSDSKFRNEFKKAKEETERGLFSWDITVIYPAYKKLDKLKSNIFTELKKELSGDEIKLLNNMQSPDVLIEQMGDKFWQALEKLVERKFIKLRLEGGSDE